MKVLVTGSSGFIGSALMAELKKQGHSLKTFDRSEGKDINDLNQVSQALKDIDVVIHLAAALDESLPWQALYQVNVSGTRNLLGEAAKQKVKRFIFLSTVGVMGSIKEQADEETALKPETNYEKSKAEAEKLVFQFKEALPVTIVRGAMVYGANRYWTGIIKLVKKGFPIIGSGENMMQLIYVKDLADAIAFLVKKKTSSGEIFIVAENNPQTLNGVYSSIAEILGTKKRPRHLPLFLGRLLAYLALLQSKLTGKKTLLLPSHVSRLVRVRHYNTAKLNGLGWQPKYSLEKGLKETVKELKAQNKI